MGEAYTATLEIFALNGLRRLNGTHRVIVRFSRGAGVPEPLPDVLGLAIKIPLRQAEAGEQDLLLASSGSAALTRNMLLPARSFLSCTYTSVLPYRVGGER
ncbi:MAG: hypothetical protein ABR613_11805, partial [Actinomycetota bacterium]